MFQSGCSILTRPQPQQFQSLAHSLKQPPRNLLKTGGMHTLWKTTGGIPLSAHFETAGAISALVSSQVILVLPPLRPPAVTRPLRIQLDLREHPASRATGARSPRCTGIRLLK